MVKIAVIGAGINGVACALRIKEKYPNYEVVIISNVFTPGTTGDGSGGLWYPYLCGNTPGHLLNKWGGETYSFIHQHWRHGGLGICMLPVYYLFREKHDAAYDWRDTVFGYQDLGERELKYLSELYSAPYIAGHTFTSFIVPPTKMISYLHHSFLKIGGQVRAGEVKSLQDPILKEFDVIVNCTGLGARDIVPDGKVYPIRGQIFRVKAPWINQAILEEEKVYYILPNDETVVLGGTHQEYDFNTEIDPKDTENILKGCRTIIPSLKNVKPISGWVGLRPGRDEVRIETERKHGKLFIHNYGHGGAGLTLFWGCAAEVLGLLETHLPSPNNGQLSKSKL